MKYIIRFSNLLIFWSKWIRSIQNGSKRIKLDQIWFLMKQSLKYIIRFSNLFIFWSKWIRSVQNGSNLIIFDFWWNNHWNISSDFQIYLFFDQIESDLSKMDGPWSNWISDEIVIEIYHQIFSLIHFLIKIDQICPKCIKLGQIWFLMK